MKFLVRASLLIVLLALSVGVTYAAGPPDIVTNGDFSNGLDAWSILGGTATVGGGSCGANTLYLETSDPGLNDQATVQQCINLTTDPSGTWTYAVGVGNATNQLSLNANYRFSVQTNCTGADTGGPYSSITTFPGSISNISHPSDALSVEITILLTEGLSGVATACIDDISFTDSGGTATAIGLAHLGAESARRPLVVLSSAVGLITLVGFLRYRRRP
jgi:hypothetical protein